MSDSLPSIEQQAAWLSSAMGSASSGDLAGKAAAGCLALALARMTARLTFRDPDVCIEMMFRAMRLDVAFEVARLESIDLDGLSERVRDTYAGDEMRLSIEDELGRVAR